MTTVVRLTSFASTSLNFMEMAEATTIETVEHCYDALVKSLVICDKY